MKKYNIALHEKENRGFYQMGGWVRLTNVDEEDKATLESFAKKYNLEIQVKESE